MIFNLEVLGRLLGDSAAEVELVHLAVLVPHGRLVVHDKLPTPAAAAATVAGGTRTRGCHHASGALKLEKRCGSTFKKLCQEPVGLIQLHFPTKLTLEWSGERPKYNAADSLIHKLVANHISFRSGTI